METVDDIVGYEDPIDDLDRLSYAVIGAAIEVHKRLGAGHLEMIYQKALCLELNARGITNDPQYEYDVYYRGQPVGKGRVDILVQNILVVEIKAVESIATIHVAQTISYLRAMNLSRALLINFNVRKLSDGV
jgi:GxxExxY protein